MLSDKQLIAIEKIDSIKDAIRQMNEGKDISNIAKRLLNAELGELRLQIENLCTETEQPNK